MPIVNRNGLAVLNGPNGPLTRHNTDVLIASGAGSACYLTGDVAIFQDMRSSSPCLSTINIKTGDTVANVNPAGCNILVAGGGAWAAHGGGTAYRDSYGHRQDDWTPLAVDGANGHVLVSIFDGYQSTLGWWDGLTLTVLPYRGLPVQLGSAGRGVAIVQVPGAAVPAVYGASGWPAIPIIDFALADGWLVGWSLQANGIVCWRTGTSPLGYVLSHDVNRFAVSVAAQANGHVLVVASLGAGERPGELVIWDVDPIADTVNGAPVARYDLTQPYVPPPDPTPEPPEPTPEPPDPLPPVPPRPPIVIEECYMLPTLPKSRLTQHYHEFPDRWIFQGADGRWLTVTDTGDVSWRASNATTLTADSSFVWAQGEPSYSAPRNGVQFSGRVDLTA